MSIIKNQKTNDIQRQKNQESNIINQEISSKDYVQLLCSDSISKNGNEVSVVLKNKKGGFYHNFISTQPTLS
jgi:hypothetical protein